MKGFKKATSISGTMSVSYGRATSGKDLRDILELQSRNLPSGLTQATMDKEGFVTVTHTLPLLQKMNKVCPHIIAKAEGRVVGYALCMHPSFSDEIPILRSMFREIESQIKEHTYMVMGQVCVDSPYRGQGVFRGLYLAMKEALKGDFDLIVTEVDGRNRRSLEAHLAIGFRVVKKYQSDGRDWYLIVL